MTAGGDILFLVHRIPFPPDRGDKIRSYHMLKAFAEMAPVHVGCFADDDRDMGFATDLARVAASQCVVRRDRSKAMAGLAGLFSHRSILVSIYENPELHRWVSEILATRPIRAIVAYSVQMATYVPLDLPPGCRFMMDFVDFDSAKYAAYGSEQDGFMGWVNRREGRVLLDFEREVARRATISTFVSAAEAQLFAQTADVQDRDVQALDNGVNLNYFNIEEDISPIENEENPLLVFTGQMDYRPNIEAVESFAREALPIVRAKYPTATFVIVGRNPTPQVQALALQPGVIVTGGVPDIRGWLMAADVVVAPLRIARGIQNKVLEAMAMGRPVVASPQAAEGIDAVNGEHFVVAADPQAEAEAVRALLADPQQAALLGKAARARMEQRYDWAATLAPLREMVLG
ncbi:MAG: TIGR03087 family PEP-CTERM/XrtA system glycosyltransferase [Sphingobium sp.]|jgi:sugar transferase (PEP-CTERM/EpsH1 system associated)|nr:TIGR03087 family PEP-CTERM/XrtA system glycosyltransferase [Sphingobium sp.]MCP5399027.1 TIGR03087 family PEP-CTERM/XrtA system glycosyltransferase [Sphingomonas sp.]